jgi:hypothetical protein
LDYVIGSAIRFMQDWPDEDVAEFIGRCRQSEKWRGQLRAAERVVLGFLN